MPTELNKIGGKAAPPASFGRFVIADWSAVPAPVPYADLTNPQTLNLYAYVKNNPLRYTDPTGHAVGWPMGSGPDPSAMGPMWTGRDHLLDSSWSNFVTVEHQWFMDGQWWTVGVSRVNAQDLQDDQRKKQKKIAQQLAAQVPPEVKAAIGAAVNASNSATTDDKEGGFHEESLKWGKDASGNVVVSPSVPGAYAPPGTNPTTNFAPANPKTDEKLVIVDGFAHIHPKGGGDRTFVQPPSGVDKDFARGSSAIHIGVGAANKKVYFFNSSGVIGSPMKLNDFMR